jgi:hypothetical protein
VQQTPRLRNRRGSTSREDADALDAVFSSAERAIVDPSKRERAGEAI